ncbi:MAG: Beta-lactamase [uncultured Thermomicrobiales bacterium]|uniref:Beta-lactamase n=1 Tax=uncultured Thermomicrobiales bacterium TaxID=1645740 RepID=A0A6J4UQN5_9BACT|nr:MAG: Beta-lactamase [uncultured Thermomicrobiales bacterium]
MVHRLIAFVVAALLVGGSTLPAAAQDSSPVANPAAAATTEGVYADPTGRFTVPIPTGWRAETVDGRGVLTDPDGLIVVHALTLEGTDPVAAVGEGWRRVDPAFAREPIDVQEPPPPANVERLAVVTYDGGEASGRVVQGVAQIADGVAYVLLYDADLLTAQRRLSQLSEIDSGFAITGAVEVDLAGVRPATLTPEQFAEFDAFAADLLARTEVPGAAIAVVQDGRIVHSKGFGVREAGRAEPVTPETLMMIGSTTKSMTTMMTATLVDEGKLGWDTPAVELLPGFAVADPVLTPRITVRNLFCACTGVPRRDYEWLFNAEDLSAEDTVASLRDFEFFTPFGEAFQYSNQMVATGGYAAAAASGEPGDLYDAYERAMRGRVLDPIGMTDSTFSFEAVRADDDHATPHGATLTGTYDALSLETETALSPIAPAGALWSSAAEMARYAITELNRGVGPDGNRVVSAENLAVTWEPQVAVDAETGYGLGWLVGEHKGAPLIEHGGNTFGFTSDLAFLPEAGLGIVTLANAQGANLFTVAVRERLLEMAYGQASEVAANVDFYLEQGQQAVADLRLGSEIDPAAVAPFVGDYVNAALGEVSLELTNGALVLDAGEFRTELLPTLNGAGAVAGYITADAPVAGALVALRRENGAPVMVVGAGVDEYDFARALPSPPVLTGAA